MYICIYNSYRLLYIYIHIYMHVYLYIYTFTYVHIKELLITFYGRTTIIPHRSYPVTQFLQQPIRQIGIIIALIMGCHTKRSDKHPKNLIEEEKMNILKQWLKAIFTRLKKKHEMKYFHGFQENINTTEIKKLLQFKILLYLIVTET